MAFRVTITVRIASTVKAFHREACRRQRAPPEPSRGRHGLERRGPLSSPRRRPRRCSLRADLPSRRHQVARGRISSTRRRRPGGRGPRDRKSTRLNSSHGYISYAVFCLKKKKKKICGTQLTKKKRNDNPSD